MCVLSDQKQEIVSKGSGKLGMEWNAYSNAGSGQPATCMKVVQKSRMRRCGAAQSQWALNKNILSKHKGGCHCTQSGSVDLAETTKK